MHGQLLWSAIKLGVEDKFDFQVSPMQAIYLPTGQKIVFKAADNPRKMKSVNLGRGYIKYAWFEEVDQFAGMADIRNILQSLFRGENHMRIAFYSFNPPKSGRSWVNQETKIEKLGRKVHHSMYLTVPKESLGDVFLAEEEHLKKTNEMAYRHEYLGEEVGTGLEIFNNITLRKITDEEIRYFDRIRQGIDFGYAVDPVVFERIHYDKTRRRCYFFDEFSGVGVSNRKLYDRIKVHKRINTTADSAEPKSIDELRSLGMNVLKAKKGSDSIEYGIKFLQDLEEVIIDPNRCPRAANEFVNYAYEMNRNGEVKSTYPDKDNHAIDAARYALEYDLKSYRAGISSAKGW